MDFSMRELTRVCEDMISRLDAVSNNLANTGTPGFKLEHMHNRTRKDNTETKRNDSRGLSSMFTDFSQGIMQKTENMLDMAIQGEGFFTIQTREGQAFTRRGNFTVNKNHQMVTQNGDYVLGERGPITINGTNIDVDNFGSIRVDGQEAGKLKIVAFENPQALVRLGGGVFADPGGARIKRMEKPDVNPGHLELSNVNAIKEMAEMIGVQRSFETYQKVMQTIAELDKLSTSRVGRLA